VQEMPETNKCIAFLDAIQYMQCMGFLGNAIAEAKQYIECLRQDKIRQDCIYTTSDTQVYKRT
jgi:hypothetical protein